MAIIDMRTSSGNTIRDRRQVTVDLKVRLFIRLFRKGLRRLTM
jgi:hypothetical protein